MHVSLKVAAGLALSTALAAPSFAAVPSDLSMNPSFGTDTFEFMTGLNFESARDWNFTSSRALIGDTFTAGVFGQNTLAATSLDGGPGVFTYASGNQNGGAHSFTGAGTRYNAVLVNPTTLIAAAFTTDGSDWLPSFTNPGDGGGNMTRLRFDVGSFSAGLDPIGGLGAQLVSAQFVLFSGGAAVFSTSLDGGPGVFTYASGNQNGGAHSFTGAGTRYNAVLVNPTTLIAAAFTTDGSDWLPSFTNPGDGGGNMTRLRFDVGSFSAGLDPIGGLGAQLVSAQFVLFSGGAAVFSTSSVLFDAGAVGLTGSAIVSGADGNNIDEVQMIFTLVPAPGAASLLGLAGLAAIRRRR